MKAVHSPLRIVDFAVTDFNFEIVPGIEDKKISEYFNLYELDIDFDIFKTDVLLVRIKALVNHSNEPLPGYRLFAAAACIFEFSPAAHITAEQANSMEGFSTVYIALNSLRGIISSFTANAPFGRYILPSIDLNNLIQQKLQQEQDAASNTSPATQKKKPS